MAMEKTGTARMGTAKTDTDRTETAAMVTMAATVTTAETVTTGKTAVLPTLRLAIRFGCLKRLDSWVREKRRPDLYLQTNPVG